jgi:hypothetical protein
MRFHRRASPLRLASSLFYSDGSLNWLLLIGIVSFGLVLIAAVLLGVYADDTWTLKRDGRGFLRHYGAWVILTGDPLLVILAGWASHKFQTTLDELPFDAPSRNVVENLKTKYLDWIAGQRRAFFGYLLCVSFGFLSWINNLCQTQTPRDFYNHDVFDSRQHFWGYIAYKTCLFVSWVIVYPIVGYTMLTITLSIWLILRTGRNNRLFKFDVMHPDNCYGLGSLGSLGVSIISPFLLVYLTILALLITHGTFYKSVSVPLAGMTLLIFLVSYVALVPGYMLFKRAKKETFGDLLLRSHPSHGKDGPGTSHFAIERICYGLTDNSPYSTTIKIIVIAINAISFSGLSVSSLEQFFVSVWR